jgi:hypothetical protein
MPRAAARRQAKDVYMRRLAVLILATTAAISVVTVPQVVLAGASGTVFFY